MKIQRESGCCTTDISIIALCPDDNEKKNWESDFVRHRHAPNQACHKDIEDKQLSQDLKLVELRKDGERQLVNQQSRNLECVN